MAILTPELRQQIEQSGDKPVRIEDPETKRTYLLVLEEVYRKLEELAVIDHSSEPSLYEVRVFRPNESYPIVDRVFAAGWNDPKMAEYDDYEKHRP